MRAEINNKGKLKILFEQYDVCNFCRNVKKCPLMQAVMQEIVILHYSDIEIKQCSFMDFKNLKEATN